MKMGERKKIISGLITVMLASSLLVGLNVLAQEEPMDELQEELMPTYGTISGDVYDINNKPITNVTVYLINDTITTFEEANALGLAAVGPYVPVTPIEDELMVAREQQGEQEVMYYSFTGIPLIGGLFRFLERLPVVGFIVRLIYKLFDWIFVKPWAVLLSHVPLIGGL
jgi:hypothetical protein